MLVNYQQLAPGSIHVLNHPALPKLSDVNQGKQDITWCMLDGDKLTALCSLWTDNVPSYRGYKTAALGHFFAQEAQAGKQLLDDVCQWLGGWGVEYVIGPMDGSTWRNYRLVCDPGSAPPFFLEYTTPCDWPQLFATTGFETIATYHSAQTCDLMYHDRSAEKFAHRLEQMGIVLRAFDPSRAETELTALYELARQSFANNFLYSPISLQEFLALYQPLLPYLVPNLFLFAEHAQRLVGIIFAIPDFLQRARGESIDSVIIKTMARLPDRQYAGLGSYLAQQLHRQAAQMGYRRVIHALMHDENASSTTSHKSAQIMRRYALYGKRV